MKNAQIIQALHQLVKELPDDARMTITCTFTLGGEGAVTSEETIVREREQRQANSLHKTASTTKTAVAPAPVFSYDEPVYVNDWTKTLDDIPFNGYRFFKATKDDQFLLNNLRDTYAKKLGCKFVIRTMEDGVCIYKIHPDASEYEMNAARKRLQMIERAEMKECRMSRKIALTKTLKALEVGKPYTYYMTLSEYGSLRSTATHWHKIDKRYRFTMKKLNDTTIRVTKLLK